MLVQQGPRQGCEALTEHHTLLGTPPTPFLCTLCGFFWDSPLGFLWCHLSPLLALPLPYHIAQMAWACNGLGSLPQPRRETTSLFGKEVPLSGSFSVSCWEGWSESSQRNSITWSGELRDTHGRLGGAAALGHASQATLALSVAKMVPTSHGHTLMITLLLEGAS